MANKLFKEEDFHPRSKDGSWKKRVAETLEGKQAVGSLKIEPVAQMQSVHIYDPTKKLDNQICLFIALKTYGLFCGFYIKKGVVWSKEKNQAMTPEWKWPVFLHLLSTNPTFRDYFETAYEIQRMGFRLEGGPKKECIYRATFIDWGNILAVLNSWPVNFHCDLNFEKFLDKKRVLELVDDKLNGTWGEIFNLVTPIYSDVINYGK